MFMSLDRKAVIRDIAIEADHPSRQEVLHPERARSYQPQPMVMPIDMDEVLIVEDNSDNSEMMQALLHSHGYSCRAIFDAHSALEYCDVLNPVMILVDIGLSGLNGLDLTRQLRQRQAIRRIPIIGITAHAEQEMRDRAHAVGCDGFLAKPFLPQDFLGLVDEHMAID